MARLEEIEDGTLRSIYFPAKLRAHYLQLAKKQGTSFSRIVVNTLESCIKNTPSPLPDVEFGEFQLD